MKKRTGSYGVSPPVGTLEKKQAFASVQEWNYFTITMLLYLFGHAGFHAPGSPLLLAFLAVVSFAVPRVRRKEKKGKRKKKKEKEAHLYFTRF